MVDHGIVTLIVLSRKDRADPRKVSSWSIP